MFITSSEGDVVLDTYTPYRYAQAITKKELEFLGRLQDIRINHDLKLSTGLNIHCFQDCKVNMEHQNKWAIELITPGKYSVG